MDINATGDVNEVVIVFEQLEAVNPRKAAELAFVAARIYQDLGMLDECRTFAKKSASLLKQANITTLEEAATRHSVIAGIALPTYIHEGVIRETFREIF